MEPLACLLYKCSSSELTAYELIELKADLSVSQHVWQCVACLQVLHDEDPVRAVVEVLIDDTDHELSFCVVFLASESVGVCIDLIDG